MLKNDKTDATVLMGLKKFIGSKGRSPSLSELADFIKFKKSKLSLPLVRLEAKHLIQYERDRGGKAVAKTLKPV